jgi:hypothetical protein
VLEVAGLRLVLDIQDSRIAHNQPRHPMLPHRRQSLLRLRMPAPLHTRDCRSDRRFYFERTRTQ